MITGKICFNFVSKAVCNHSEARLVDGPSPSEGLLEVCRDGRWGTVCDDLWGIRETLVACRQLGYTSGESCLYLVCFRTVRPIAYGIRVPYSLCRDDPGEKWRPN